METAYTHAIVTLGILFPYALLALILVDHRHRGKRDQQTIERLTTELMAFKNPWAHDMAVQRVGQLEDARRQQEQAERLVAQTMGDDFLPEDTI